MTRLAQLKAEAERATSRFEEARGRLFRADGAKVYAEAEHEERLRRLRAERNRELDRIEAEADSAFEEATEEISALENASPLSWLGEEDLARASGGQALAAADVASLARDELLKRLASVRRGGDRASQVCYLLASRGKAPGGEDDVEMSAALDDLREAIVPDDHRSKTEAARRALEEASEVKSIAWLARREQSQAYAPTYSIGGRP